MDLIMSEETKQTENTENQEKMELRVPNVTGAIIGHFIMEAAHRVQGQLDGELSEEEVDEADQKTISWMGNTFCGLNSQFTADPSWYPDGLAGNLRFKVGSELSQACGGRIPDDNKAVIFAACALFMAQTYSTLYDLKRQGVDFFKETTAPELLWHLKRWTEFLVGHDVEFHDPTKDDGEGSPKKEKDQ